MSDPTEPAGPDEDVRRLAAFSDAVFAIAMTLLVLELKIPETAEIHTSAELHEALAQWSAYGAFALSFGVIALYWRVHFSAFRRLQHVDSVLLWLNLVLLLGITFLPFPTAVIQRFGDERLAVMLYAGTLAAIGYVWAGMWGWTVRRELFTSSITAEQVRISAIRLVIPPTVFLLSIGVAWFEPQWAIRSWLLITVMTLVRHRKRTA